MALLAGSKRKQKLSIDPRGLNWSQDDSKFGQKMLEKFGWSQGKGLGAQETGRVEHVKLNYKMDNRGVGFSKKEENNWIPLQDEFSDLLATLNANHGQGESSGEVQVQSLEERSKTSKGRLHYQKFTRGKDLAGKTNEDMDCIFGRSKSKSAPVTPQNMSKANSAVNSAESSDTEEMSSADKPDENEETEHGVTTIASSLSVQDYFRQKMEQLKARRASNSAPDLVSMGGGGSEEETKETKKEKKSKKKSKSSSDEDSNKASDDCELNPRKRKHESDDESERPKKVLFELGGDCQNEENPEVLKSEKKKKKKKKSKKKSETDSQDEVNCDNSNETVNVAEVVEDDEGLVKSEKKKKKKKRKSKDRDTEVTQMNEENTESAEETSCVQEDITEEDRSEKKKKKKKKSKRREQDESGETEIVENAESNDSDTRDSAIAVVTDEPTDTSKSKNKKKKDKSGKNRKGDFPGVSWRPIEGYGGGVSLKHSWNN